MSSDDYFDDELPSALLNQFDLIDAAHSSGTQPLQANKVHALPKPRPPPPVINVDDSDEFGDLDDIFIDEDAFKAIDQACDDVLTRDGRRPPIASGSKSTFSRTSSKATIQTTLTGGVVQQKSPTKKAPASSSRSPLQRRTSSAGNNLLRGKPKKTKQWDHTAFAKTGWKKPKTVKGKEKASNPDEYDEEFEEEEIEFEQFPAPFIPLGPTPEMKLKIDRLAAKRWIYPLNKERRDYQFNIVKKCLYENTLVALPTGLGKTFIAGVVMLNFYTWFPEGKVVFVAPTKPLVAQQIDACHQTCGIPGSHAAELTGQNAKHIRAKAWEEKRIFYMTPQTLMNDLISDNCDARDIVLIVIDEAHKGSGDYAYAQVIRYMMAKNPHFRIMALTATPGSKPEAVQAIVDALHISHIEIRDEHSLDLKPYLHKKHIKQHIIEMSDDVAKVRDMLSEVMAPSIKKLAGAGILRANPSPVMLHPFSCNSAMRELHARGPSGAWAYPMLQKLGGLARAMGYLLESSTAQCYNCLQELSSAPPKGKQKQNPYQSDPKIQAILQELEAQKNKTGGFLTHPKMEKLKMLLIEHFAQKRFEKEDADLEGGREGVTGESCVMVFCSFRQCVEEVVKFLNLDSPMIRAVPFIGQGTDKSGKKGYGQKEQLDVIKRFKAGVFNVLVSTSIGEEGLDIGEIDMIVCYEAQKTPIRMLQRVGRTGRKRDGYVHVLLSEVREERNWDKAHENYEDVQRFIIKAEDLELYGDVERLVPPEYNPQCVEMIMEIEEYVRDDGPPKRVLKSPKSRAKAKDPKRNMPATASSGFVVASQLVLKGGGNQLLEIDDRMLEDDSGDQEIMAGISGPRRTMSMPQRTQTKKKGLRRAATTAAKGTKKATKSTRKKKQETEELTLSQIDRKLRDDSDDEVIVKGLTAKPATAKRPPSPSPFTSSPSSRRRELSSSPDIPLVDEVIDLTTPDPPSFPSPQPQAMLPSPSPDPFALSPEHRSVALSDSRKSVSHSRSPSLGFHASSSASSPSNPPEHPAQEEDPDMAWLLDDDDEEGSEFHLVGSSPLRQRQGVEEEKLSESRHASNTTFLFDDAPDEMCDSEPEIVKDEALPLSAMSMHSPALHRGSARPSRSTPHGLDMPPPPLPVRFAVPATPPQPSPGGKRAWSGAEVGSSPLEMPSSTFDVRGPSKGKKRARAAVEIGSSPLAMPAPAQRRLQRGRSPSPPAPDDGEVEEAEKPRVKRRKFRDIVDAQRHNPWMDVEASHSGDEHSEGASEGDDLGSEGDQRFVQELPETQVSASYDQSAIYRQSLMTQAGNNIPAFANRPLRRGAGFVFRTPTRSSRAMLPSSSPPQQDDGDDYILGSFIVDDDEEISYATEQSLLSDT